MNAIDFLIKEHNHVKKVLGDIANDSHRFETRQKLFASLAKELKVHEKMEQTIWYPRLKQEEGLKSVIDHLVEEEKKAKTSIESLEKVKDEDQWMKDFKALKKDVLHHASEEETKLFPKVRKMLERSELETLGLEMHGYKVDHLK